MSMSQSDIRKKGFLIKLKTMKKKLFVLREDTAAGGPARFEYYDSEKKFKSGAAPKRSIILSTCFSINPKSDAKHKHAIALFTKDDCFTVVCDSEEEQNDWLQAMLELRNVGREADQGTGIPLFAAKLAMVKAMSYFRKVKDWFGRSWNDREEHIWLVTVKPKGLGNRGFLTPGQYRLCLTNKTLGLVKLSHEDPEITFQLDTIRRCGHRDQFFLLELGRGCKTGEGELWLQVEDTVIAQNMHENIVSAMKANKSNTEDLQQKGQFRNRSRTTTDKGIKPSNNRKTQSNMTFDASTLPKRSKTLSAGDNVVFRRTSQSPSKSSSTLSYGSNGGMKALSQTSVSSASASPMAPSPISQSLTEKSCMSQDYRLRTNSMESHGSSRGTASSQSADEMEPDHQHSGSGSMTQEVDSYLDMTPGQRGGLTIPLSVPSAKEGYMDMSPVLFSQGHSLAAAHFAPSSQPDDSYMPMSIGGKKASESDYLDMCTTPTSTKSEEHWDIASTPTTENAYMHMDISRGHSKTDAYLDMAPGLPDLSSSALGAAMSSTSALSTTSSGHESDEGRNMSAGGGSSAYMEMATASSQSGLSLSPVQERLAADGGYLDMSSPKGSNSSFSHLQRGSPTVRPERVISYLRDEDDSGDFPKRAYSVGSKASVLHNRPLVESYVDMQGGHLVEKKSSSTPHLNEDPKASQESKRKEDLPDLFMEMDFNKDSTDSLELRPRTSSIGSSKDFRPRTSSGGSSKDFHSRTSSFGSKDFRSRTSSFGPDERHFRTGSVGKRDKLSKLVSLIRVQNDSSHDSHRPRTATICQDSLRPRTSSFGSADMRPRSSSHGNARLRDIFKKRTDPTKHASQESLRRGKIASQESLSSTCSDYLDMQPKPGTSPSQALVSSLKKSIDANNDAGYIAMDCNTGTSTSPLAKGTPDSGYMAMDKLSSPNSPSLALKVSKQGRVKSHLGAPKMTMTSSSESLSSSSSVDAKAQSNRQGLAHEYTEMDFSKVATSAKPPINAASSLSGKENIKIPEEGFYNAYVSYSPSATGKDSQAVGFSSGTKVSHGLDKVTSPIRVDVPTLGGSGDKHEKTSPSATPPTHTGLHGPRTSTGEKAKKKGPEYINLNYGDTNVRETLVEEENTASPTSKSNNPLVLASRKAQKELVVSSTAAGKSRDSLAAVAEAPAILEAESNVASATEEKKSDTSKPVLQSVSPAVAEESPYLMINPPSQTSTQINKGSEAAKMPSVPVPSKVGAHIKATSRASPSKPTAPKVKVPKPPGGVAASYSLSPPAGLGAPLTSPDHSTATLSPASTSSSASNSPNPALSPKTSIPMDPFQLNVKASVPDTSAPPAKSPVKVNTLGASPMPSRGSCGSLFGMDGFKSNPGNTGLGLGERSKSNQYLSAQDPNSVNPALSKSSLNSSECEINYATLDLSSSREDTTFLGSGPTHSNKSRHGSGDEPDVPLQYAEIDFESSQEQKSNSPSSGKEPKFTL